MKKFMVFILLVGQTIICTEQQAPVRGPLKELKPVLHALVEYALTHQDQAITQMAESLVCDSDEINARYRDGNNYKATTALYELQKHKPYVCSIQKTAQILEDFLKSKGAVSGFSVRVVASEDFDLNQDICITDIKDFSDSLDDKMLEVGKILQEKS